MVINARLSFVIVPLVAGMIGLLAGRLIGRFVGSMVGIGVSTLAEVCIIAAFVVVNILKDLMPVSHAVDMRAGLCGGPVFNDDALIVV